LKNKVKYNDAIVGILLINPDNPTGMVYPEEFLKEVVEIAKEYNLFIISDEIYGDLTYNGAKYFSINNFIEEVPTIIMRGISKELPWPGSRCGWIEIYNKDKDVDFARYVKTIVDAKMLEVCSTTLPQAAIPELLSDSRYMESIKERTSFIEKKSNYVYEQLKDVKGIIVNKTYGAFYDSIVFDDGVLNSNQRMKIENLQIKDLVEREVENTSLDKRFVYYLLGSTGICVVPLTSFCSDLQGFRMTLLETDWDKFVILVDTLKSSIIEYLK
jgi:aspartate/methionine/tyrosine aminotransferase